MSFNTPTIYEELGIHRIINAFEAVTMYGGSVMDQSVVDAMASASEGYYDILELNRAIGDRIAFLTHNEAAFITVGASAALALSAAAIIAGKSRVIRDALPLNANSDNISKKNSTEIVSAKDEIIVFRCQTNPYNRALQLPGSKIIEIGYPTHKAERYQLEDAISEKTAAIFYSTGTIFERYALRLEETAEIARAHNIPLVVDGAAQIPPRENLWKFTQQGASLAIFSGGKGIRGPQNTGLIVGNRSLIEDIEAISSPFQGFGRPMKTSKEAMIGLLKAIEVLLSEDYSLRYQEMMQDLQKMIRTIKGEFFEDIYILEKGRQGQQYPRAVFVIKDQKDGAREVFMKRLMDAGEPSVLVGPLDENERAFYVNPFGLQSRGEYDLVASRINEELTR